MIGEHVGKYKLIRELGQGGMGAVYLADRDDGYFHQRVAIKLIKRGMDTDFILKRFRHERQILATLNHPNIARLLDGGTTADRLPFFVMEYIEGTPLLQFGKANNLGLKEKLEIFRQICEAVEEAHEHKIVHRDLKPSNILVKPDGAPKLLDFGIAKLLDTDLISETLEPTATAMRLMTPEYASPEQVSGAEITTASDIYSLGILLYEFLTGEKPYQLKRRAPHEIAKVVCEQEPAAPSAKTPELSDDIDRIVLKALRKDPAERYTSAAEFAADMTRHLENRPVLARLYPPKIKAKIEKPMSDKTSVAILPFKIFGKKSIEDTGGNEFLGVGLADALIFRLSGTDRLVVRPTSSVLRFDETTDSFAAGRELEVDYVVDGNIRLIGDRIRISAQLLNVAENSTQWAQKFDEKAADVLELEDTLSEKVSALLLPHLTGAEPEKLRKRGTDNAEAFEAYLRGRFYWNQFTADSLPKALQSFERAVKLDPNYALAYVGLADFYNWACIYGILPPATSYPQIKTCLERALEIDNSLGEAYAVLGLYNTNHWNYIEGEKNHHRAIELAPNYSLAHEWLAANLVSTGRFDEGLNEIRLAEQLDPLSLRAKTLTAWTFYQARDFEAALAKGHEIIELDKNFPQGYLQVGNALIHLGRPAEAVEYCRKSLELMPDSTLPRYVLISSLAAAGRIEEARQEVLRLEDLAAQSYVKPYFLGMSQLAIGEIDKALGYFETTLAEKDMWCIWFGTEIKLDVIRAEARFSELFSRTKNPLAMQQRRAAGQSAKAEKSVAVLPLKLLKTETTGETEEDHYLCLGLADAMITRLSNVRRLVVRPTSSILRFGQETSDPFAAGRELKVEFIVEGTMRRIDERIRISVQLLSVKENSIVWADRYDEKFTDVLELEDRVSEKIARSLIPELTGEEEKQLQKRGTNSATAYEAYMRGRYLANQFTNDALLKSLAAFEEAIRIDPDYALPRVGIAEFYVWSSIFGAFPSHQAYPKAKEELNRALAIDATLAEAYALGSFVALLYDWNWAKAERLVKKSLEINPNYYFAHNTYAHIFASQGIAGQAMKEIKISEALDPLSPLAKVMTSCIAYQVQHFDEGALKARQASEMQLKFPQGFLHLGNSLTHLGGTAEAVEVLTTLTQLWSDSALPKFMLCFALAADGQIKQAEEVLQASLAIAEREFVKPYFIAMAYTAVGEIAGRLNGLRKPSRRGMNG